MGSVKLRYIGLIQNVLGSRQEEISVSAGATVRTLLQDLAERHGVEFRHAVLRSNGELRPTVAIQVGDREIKELSGLDTVLSADSQVTVFITGHPDPGG